MRLAAFALLVLTTVSSAEACFFPFFPGGGCGYGLGWPAPLAYQPMFAPGPTFAAAPACNSCGYGNFNYATNYGFGYGANCNGGCATGGCATGSCGTGGCATGSCNTFGTYSAGFATTDCGSCGNLGCGNCVAGCAPGQIITQPQADPSNDVNDGRGRAGDPNQDYEPNRDLRNDFSGRSGGANRPGRGTGREGERSNFGGTGAGRDGLGGIGDAESDAGGRPGGWGTRDLPGDRPSDYFNEDPAGNGVERRNKPPVTDPIEEEGTTESEDAKSNGEMLAPERNTEQAQAILQMVSSERRRTNPFETRRLHRGVSQTRMAVQPKTFSRVSDSHRVDRPLRWISLPTPGRIQL